MNKLPLLTWWILWAALQIGIVLMHTFLPHLEAPEGQNSMLWLAALAPLAISASIRWVVLPRISNVQTALALFMVGMMTAEATNILGIFLFPDNRQDLFILSFLGIFQFAPRFASRFYPR